MKKYSRITWTERLQIEKLYNSGSSERNIALRLGRAPSCIHYELQHGFYMHLIGSTWEKEKRYSAQIAQDYTDFQSTSHGRPIALGNNYDYAELVARRLKDGESPDSITGDLARNGSWTVSTNTLYRYIDKGYIPNVSNDDLLRKGNQKKAIHDKRSGKRPPKGVSIENRPVDINKRDTPGHWEMDTVIGKASGKSEALLVLTERFTRKEIIKKLEEKTTNEVVSHLTQIVASYPSGTFLSLTVDNGSENQDYEAMKKIVGEVYYCHPYCSSERGSNENANGLIRRFFPKHESMSDKTQADADEAAYFINNMHRKILGYATSQELFDTWQLDLRLSC